MRRACVCVFELSGYVDVCVCWGGVLVKLVKFFTWENLNVYGDFFEVCLYEHPVHM